MRGRLQAADLHRLEQACGQALEHERIPLELRLEQVTAIDEVARAYLDRLRARGALICDLRVISEAP